jgi:hypothetical protein
MDERADSLCLSIYIIYDFCHCLVNWPNVCVLKDLGGLGVPDLEGFGRALHLRWIWHEWGDDPKPWVETEVPCKDMVRLLFNASTMVTIGNGNKTCFWHHNWLDGRHPNI